MAVSDQESGEVLHVTDDPRQASLDGSYLGLSETQRTGIESMCMDIRSPCIASTQKHVPGAGEKIAFDKFHEAEHLVMRWTECDGVGTGRLFSSAVLARRDAISLAAQPAKS